MFCFLTFSKQTVQRQPSCPCLVAAEQAGAGLLFTHHEAALWASPSLLFLVQPSPGTLLSCCAPGPPTHSSQCVHSSPAPSSPAWWIKAGDTSPCHRESSFRAVYVCMGVGWERGVEQLWPLSRGSTGVLMRLCPHSLSRGPRL